jgi:hypothetical protein
MKHFSYKEDYSYIYEWFWLTKFKFCVSPIKNFNFNISELQSYVAIKYNRIIYDTILECYIINIH